MDGWHAEIVAQLKLGVIVWQLDDPADDDSLRLRYANPAAERELGRSLAEDLGRRLREIFPDVPPERQKVYADACRGQQVRHLGSMSYRPPDGEARHLSVTAYPMPDRAVAVVFENQSELRAAVAREHALGQFLDSVVENMPAMVFVKDARHLRFERFNRAGEQLLGLPRAALLGKSDYDFFPPEQAEFFTAKDREVLRRRELTDIPEEPIETPRGTRWLHTRKIPLYDENGEPAHLLGLSIDITEQRSVDEMRREFYIALEAENLRVLEATRVKSEFLASMSHELRTPLNAIIGFATVLAEDREHPLTPTQREYLGDIQTSGQHLLRLISDVLDLSKVESGRIELSPETVDVAALVDEVLSTLRLAATSKAISVEREIAVAEVVVDPDRMKQVLYNYLSNALKFTGDGGRVIVRVLPEGDERFRLEVEDTGVGIEARDFPRLFIDFQQLETGSAKRYGGTGLGLALTKRLVEAQGGTVGVKSVPGQGSIFHAILPRRPAP